MRLDPGTQETAASLLQRLNERDLAVKEIERVQQETRATLAADRTALEQELAAVRADRDAKAQRVSRSLLQKYDRIRSRRRATAVFPLRGKSCAHCDTAIPGRWSPRFDGQIASQPFLPGGRRRLSVFDSM